MSDGPVAYWTAGIAPSPADDHRLPADTEQLVRLDFYIAGDRVDALSVMVHKTEAERVARSAASKLKEVIPRQQFKVALQAAVGGDSITIRTKDPAGLSAEIQKQLNLSMLIPHSFGWEIQKLSFYMLPTAIVPLPNLLKKKAKACII